MHDQGANLTILWQEGAHRCELWNTAGGSELRVYISDVLTYREPVRNGTGGLQQAARLLADARATISSFPLP